MFYTLKIKFNLKIKILKSRQNIQKFLNLHLKSDHFGKI